MSLLNDARREGRQEGLQEGRQEGEYLTKRNTARNLISLGSLTVEQIAQATALSVQEVQAIAAELYK